MVSRRLRPRRAALGAGDLKQHRGTHSEEVGTVGVSPNPRLSDGACSGSESFGTRTAQGTSHRHYTVPQRADGWGWSRQPEGVSRAA